MLGRVLSVLTLATIGLPLAAAADIGDFIGKRLAAVQVEVAGQPSDDSALINLIETRAGEPLQMIRVRETIDHLTGLGRFEDVRVYARAAPSGDGVVLRWSLVPVQRIVRVRFSGSPVFSDDELQSTLAMGTTPTLGLARVPALIERLHAFYEDHGYRRAEIASRIVPTSRPDEAELDLTIRPGPRTTIAAVAVAGHPLASEQDVLDRLRLRVGAAYDRPELERRMDEYEEDLRGERYYEADLSHTETFSEDGATASITVNVEPGPRVRVVFAGDPLPEGREDDLVPIRRERSVEEDLLEDSARNIERYLRDEGYRSAAVSYMRSEQNGELVLTFTVERGLLYRVGSVDVSGATSLPRSDLTPLLKLSPGEPFVDERAATIASAMTELYQVRGYASAAVKFETPTLPPSPELAPGERVVDVRFVVTEGPQTTVDAVTVEGAAELGEARVRSLLRLLPGRPFYRPQLAADREAIEREYRNQGFHRATVEGQPAISDDGRTVAVTWVIEEGPQTYVDHILVTGNEHISAEVIRRELTLTPGEPLGEDALVESQRRLSALGLFRRVRVTELPYGASDDHDILVEVEEGPTTTMAYGGGIEVQQRSQRAEDGTAEDHLDVAPRAFFEIGRRNLWGKNRSVNLFTRVSFRRRDPGIEQTDPTDTGGYGFNEYRVVGTYREPRAFGAPGDLQFTGYAEQAIRTSYSFRRRGTGAEYARRLAQGFSVSGRYMLDRSETFDEQIAPEDQPLIDKLFPQVRLSTFTGTVLRDTRDDVLDPHQGTVLGIDNSIAARALGSQVGFVRSLMRGFYYRRVPGATQLVLAVGVRVGVARGFAREVVQAGENGQPITVIVKDLPASERFFAGGDTTVRGFALDRLGTDETLDVNGFPTGGNGMLVGNVEVRTPYWKGLGLVGFLDAGNVYELASDIDITEIRGGAGFGIRYRSPVGPLRVDLGFNLDPRVLPGGSRERRAVLHISLGQAF